MSRFLESAWHAREALYAAFVLVLVLGLRKVKSSALPGIRSTSMTLSCTWESSSSESGAGLSAAKSRPRHLRHGCHFPTCA